MGVKQKTEPFSGKTIALQSWLRPALTPVLLNCDYEAFRWDLEKIDLDIRASAVEAQAVEMALEALPAGSGAGPRQRRAQFAIFALRAEVLRHVVGLPSFRAFSRMLASSDLLSDFCGVRTLEGIKWTSKSTLERASKVFDKGQLRRLHQTLAEVTAHEEWCGEVGLDRPVDASVSLVDATCLEANIHFPVDWVLLRDVAITLLKATKLIRGEGLLCRMPGPPEAFIRQMNGLCMEMTHSRRRQDAAKKRKKVLRKMKKLLRSLGGHARRHRDKLERQWEQTRWSRRQAERIMERIDEKLALLPQVAHQAHERIIGGRKIPSADKILSAHERDLHVIVRGKAARETEFGNTLFLAEGPDGFIFDYKLYRQAAPPDTAMLEQSLQRQNAMDIGKAIEEVVGDRGFASKRLESKLQAAEVTSSICPKNPAELQERMKDPRFARSQKRRAGTEARIAILKNHGGGRPCRSKGFHNRARAVGWAVLAHNLWWIARTVRGSTNKEDDLAA